ACWRRISAGVRSNFAPADMARPRAAPHLLLRKILYRKQSVRGIMARSLNKVMLIGNVGSEPEIRTTASGKRVAKFSVATNRQYTDRSGQQQEKTEWHRCTAWDRVAEI